MIEAFAEVDVSALAAQLADSRSLACARAMRAVADELMGHFPDCVYSGVGLFLLAPGQVHPAHTDEQPPEWVTRVHVPVITNSGATATTDQGTIHMRAGIAYKFDTRQAHAVRNDGDETRVHLVFEVRTK